LARASGIPARFYYGFYVPEKQVGNPVAHCWAEFYSTEEKKWYPIDASEADKNPEKKDYFFGNFDRNRVAFTCGRDIILTPRQKGEALNFLIHPYIEVDGIPLEKVETEYTFSECPD
jgi:transglutaminase-like putative cysteine protease